MKDDNIDKRIERVMESLGSKRAAMLQWEIERVNSEKQRKVVVKRWRTFGISAAASIVVIYVIGLGLYKNSTGLQNSGVGTYDTIYRTGSSDIGEIMSMINSGEYQEALQAIDVSLGDTIINQAYPIERQEYLRSVNKNKEYELIWLKILVLNKLNKEQDAYMILELYANQKGVHQIEAQELLEKMKE